MYHSYHGNPDEGVISNKTRTNVIIYPPEGAVYWLECFHEDISLTQKQDMITLFRKDSPVVNMHTAINAPDYDWLRDSRGPQYYEYTIPLFNDRESSSVSTPLQLADKDRGNLYLTAWYDAKHKLIRVDWLVETSDDFSIPQDNIKPIIFPSYPSEDALPDKITQPSLVNPKTSRNEEFTLVMYYYPSYRGNTDFAELHMLDSDDNVVSKFHDGEVVIYWPYPEGYSYDSPVHYQLKHYLDSTRTEFEMLNVTPTKRGLRIVTNSFSPFELIWTEMESMPQTGDSENFDLWLAAGLMSCMTMAFLYSRKRRTN